MSGSTSVSSPTVPLFRRILRVLMAPFTPRLVHAISEEWGRKRTAFLISKLKHASGDLQIQTTTAIYNAEAVTFGDRCILNDYVVVLGAGGVTFGDGVWVAAHAMIISHSHPADVEFIGDHPMLTAPIVLEDNVWIGGHAVILPGVRLGRSCIVAAGSVVTKDVPPYAIVAGIPARVIRYKDIAPTS